MMDSNGEFMQGRILIYVRPNFGGVKRVVSVGSLGTREGRESLCGGTMSTPNAQSPDEVRAMMSQANLEMEALTNFIERMTHTCFDKCSERRYGNADLSVGELTCIDRCAHKYWQTKGIVGDSMTSTMQQLQGAATQPPS